MFPFIKFDVVQFYRYVSKELIIKSISCPGQDFKRYPSVAQLDSRKDFSCTGSFTKHFERLFVAQ